MYRLLTLGVYDLVWFARTRRRLVAVPGVRAPGMAWLIATYVVGVVAWIGAVVLVLVQERLRISRPNVVIALCVVVLLSTSIVSLVWQWRYVLAFERAVGGRISRQKIWYLLNTMPSYGITLLQSVLDNPATTPDFQMGYGLMRNVLTFPPSIEHNKWLRLILKTIIVGLVVLIVLLVLFWVVVTRLG